MTTDSTTTHGALAELFGISKKAVNELAARGIIVRSGNGYALKASVRGYCDHLRKLATGRGGEAAISAGTTERARPASAQADIAETKAAKLRGSLVEAAEVEAAWGGVLRTVRAGCLAVPSRVAQRLLHLTLVRERREPSYSRLLASSWEQLALPSRSPKAMPASARCFKSLSCVSQSNVIMAKTARKSSHPTAMRIVPKIKRRPYQEMVACLLRIFGDEVTFPGSEGWFSGGVYLSADTAFAR
jgi:terminase small subunit / prophage DNA-packing protein